MIPGEAPKGDQKRQPSGVIPDAAVEAAAPKYACAVIVCDGPYTMTCSYMIVGGRCVRHGEGSATYEVKAAK